MSNDSHKVYAFFMSSTDTQIACHIPNSSIEYISQAGKYAACFYISSYVAYKYFFPQKAFVDRELNLFNVK